MYRIELSNTAYKFFRKPKISKKIFDLIKQKILSLQEDSRHAGCEKLKSVLTNYYRVRQGDFRIVYEINNKESKVIIIAI